jgi:hypothetical protein
MKPVATEKKSALSKGLGAVGGILKGAGGKIVEQVQGVKPALSGYGESSLEMLQKTKGNPLAMMLATTTPIAGSIGKRGLDVLKSGVETVRSTPQAFKSLGVSLGQLARGDDMSAPLETKLLSPEAQARLQETTKGQREAIEGVGGLFPEPVTQFAVGLSKGQREGIEEGYSGAEATGRGLVEGGERFLVMKGLQKLFSRGAEKQKVIEEKISPKMTQKQQEWAIKQGRVAVQKQSKLREWLFGKKDPKVTAPKSVKDARLTIEKEIPHADKLDDFTLQQRIDTKVGEVANKLKPQLEKVILDPKAVPKLKSEWNVLKNKQAADFNAVDYKLGSMQKDFDKVLTKATTKAKDMATGQYRLKNMDDIWEVAKAYDKTIPDSIKNALPNSGLAWAKRQAWIENRNLLRNFIKENAAQAKEAFSTMHNLMTASENIVEKGIPKTATPGLLTKRNIGIAGGAYLLKKFGLDRLTGSGSNSD